VRDRAQQEQLNIGWGPSAQNLGEYFTKHHTPSHHKGIRGMYLHSDNSPRYIPTARKKPPQGCVDSALSPGAPANHHVNSVMADKPRTAKKRFCLVRNLFRAPHSTFISSHKFC
jgi:hypothetical protein